MSRSNRIHEGVKSLAVTMEEKMSLNEHKGLWDGISDIQLCKYMQGEVDEVVDAVLHGTDDEIQKECADVANFAMMLHDNVKRRASGNKNVDREVLIKEITYCDKPFMIVHDWDDDARTNMQILSIHAGYSTSTPDIYDFLRDDVLKDLYKLLEESYCS